MYLKYIDDLPNNNLKIGNSAAIRKGLNQRDPRTSVIDPQHGGLCDNGILS